MKTNKKSTKNVVELTVWQFLAIIVASIACLIAIIPLVARYRSNQCPVTLINNALDLSSSRLNFSSNYHKRYVRNVRTREQCDIIPPTCSATLNTTTATVSTTRSTVSTVSVTRPNITPLTTTPQTTTPDPWTNRTRPYNSSQLPTFAKPIDYQLRIDCPDCFAPIAGSPILTFIGQVTIRINISSATDYLVLHAKNLNITEAKIVVGGTGTASITSIPEYEMIYLSFAPSTISINEISLLIDYTGIVNEQDQIGFYRELFWKSTGDISYLFAANFQPIYARRAFPCFDEPNMQATFSLTLLHPRNSTIALSNNVPENEMATMTIFRSTPVLSPHLFAWAILPLDEFVAVKQVFVNTTVNIWLRSELTSTANINLNQTFDVIEKTFQFIEDYLNVSPDMFPAKLDFVGVPDLILDEKASSSWGFLTFREEFLSVDFSLNSAERLQTTTKILVEHILEIWLSKTNWWDNHWFEKSLSSLLAYKMIEKTYPEFEMMEQFPLREMIPLMIDDFKPSILPISNKNLITNEQILDSLSVDLYSKGAALLRLLEYIVGVDEFQSAVRNILPVNDLSNVLTVFYSSFNQLLDSSITVDEFLRPWLEERNYPIVTIEFLPKNETNQNTTIIFRQNRYTGLFSSNETSTWNIYIECDLGGTDETGMENLTGNYNQSRIKFLLQSSVHTFEFNDEDYLWIKCNKDFYSYHVNEYIFNGEDKYNLWKSFQLLFREEIFSNKDKANLLNDAFLLPYGGSGVTYEQTLNLVRTLFSNPVENYIPWLTFARHWFSLIDLDEHSKYFWNFKLFTTRQILDPFNRDIDNLITNGTDHQERLLKSTLFELLCRVQNPSALTKATELFRLISSDYFYNSSSVTNINADYLSTVIYYHLQNTNDIDEWDSLWIRLTENRWITSQQRTVLLQALTSSKEIWRLKSLLEIASNTNSNLIKSQEFFDLIISMSENPNSRDIIWNFYRQNYPSLVNRFGRTNHLFNQLLFNLVQSFENKYYELQLTNFLNQYPHASQIQQLALEQIRLNIQWINNGLAEYLDDAITSIE